MKLKTNAEVYTALPGCRELAAPVNRLSTIPSRLRASRNHAAVSAAWAPCERIRVDLIQEHGKTEKNGDTKVLPGTPGWELFAKEFNELLATPCDVDVEQIPMADITNGYAKDEATGKKEPIDIGGTALLGLIELGIVVDPDAKPAAVEEKKVVQKVEGAVPAPDNMGDAAGAVG